MNEIAGDFSLYLEVFPRLLSDQAEWAVALQKSL